MNSAKTRPTFAGDASQSLAPRPDDGRRLRVRRDALGQWWSGPFAGAADVRALLAEGVADALLPATRPDYPIDDMMLTGLSAKSTLEAVIAAVETMLAHPTVAEAAARASVIFEAGLGAEWPAYCMIEP